MKNLNLAAFLLGVLHPVLAVAEPASADDITGAWLAFSNARGEASLILGDVEHPSANDVFRVIPEVGGDNLDEEKLALGTDLFNEPRLSRDGSMACSSCHIAMLGGVDRSPVSFGIGRARGRFNAPTIFNAALNFRQFWDGRALTLEDQALGPIENPIELGHDLDDVVAMLQSIPEYRDAFNRIYPDGVSAANLADAIAYYQVVNFTGLSSPFLRQLEEQLEPLNSRARRGQQRFVEVGCASCHNGVNLGGNSYQRLGVARPWYSSDRPATEADDGLFARTGREQDRHVFKVPTLHHVAATGPWLHDGSITSLQQAVDLMARHQLGRYLDNDDIDDITAFLRALGDSLGMVGDCAVSGSYSISMDCDVSRAGAGETQDSEVFRAPLPDPATLVKRHHEEYLRALAHVAGAPQRIAEEMRRIRSGDVAHYDFLQYAHFDMMRHARALSFPPADVEQEAREALLLQAAGLQESAARYELRIADFLRAHALVNSARSAIQDLLRIMAVDADEQVRTRLAKAEESAQAFYRQPNPETQENLDRATRALHGIDLPPRQLEEFRLQVRLLQENIALPPG